MPRLIIKGPDGQGAQGIELSTGETALIGRNPKPEVSARVGAGATAPARRLMVPAPSVSANHLLVSGVPDGLVIQDLNSRNGSWLLLPRGQSITMVGPETVVQLGTSSSGVPTIDEPPAPRWRGPGDYGKAVVEAIREWPKLNQLDLEVRVTERHEEDSLLGGIPLASGESLELVPRATTDANWSELQERLWRWVERHNIVFDAEQRTRDEGMILASEAVRTAHREVVEAARGESRTLLLCGPSGAGKEMLAEVFHRHSGRSGPFVAVNCAMFSKDLLRSELFGAEAGSFTGATRRIVGAVERAQGGTLFLDEIGEVADEVQPMLLRFLDRREYETVGRYGHAQQADVRVVAATNKDLREATRSGKFRADLWFRLCVHVVEVPALAQRWDDILAYLESTRVPGGSHSLHAALSPDALEVLRAHTWEGNFRELTNLRERLPSGATPGSIDAATCQRALERGSLRSQVPSPRPQDRQELETDWAALASIATRAFREDYGHDPLSWDDQKDWNEKYLKPLVFHHLSGAGKDAAPESDDALGALAAKAAARLRADRGTALKQLSRYFTRFSR